MNRVALASLGIVLASFVFFACGGKVVFDGVPGAGGASSSSSSSSSMSTGVCDPSACPDVDCGGFKVHGCVDNHCGTAAELCGGTSVAVSGTTGPTGTGGGTNCVKHCAEAITNPCPIICDPNEPQWNALSTCAAASCFNECVNAQCGDQACLTCLQSKCSQEFQNCANDI